VKLSSDRPPANLRSWRIPWPSSFHMYQNVPPNGFPSQLLHRMNPITQPSLPSVVQSPTPTSHESNCQLNMPPHDPVFKPPPPPHQNFVDQSTHHHKPIQSNKRALSAAAPIIPSTMPMQELRSQANAHSPNRIECAQTYIRVSRPAQVPPKCYC